MSDLEDFSKTVPKLETVDAEAIPGGLEPGSGTAKSKFGESSTRKKNIPKGLWTKCGKCSELIFDKDLEENLKTCTSCGFHFPISARARLASLIDEDSFQEMDAGMASVDVLKFTGVASYPSKLERYQGKTGESDAVITGLCQMGSHKVALGIMDFSFLGGSMGSVVGERITRLIERATAQKLPLLIVCASGGARMQEGMLSLMQMAKISGALERHREAELLYMPLLTHPTTGGVTASFAMLGDLILAEPKALIGFAGRRVIKQTLREKLPDNFQTAEYLRDHGFVDVIVPRTQLRSTLARVLRLHGCAALELTSA